MLEGGSSSAAGSTIYRMSVVSEALKDYLDSEPSNSNIYKIRRRPAGASKRRISFAYEPWYGTFKNGVVKAGGKRHKV